MDKAAPCGGKGRVAPGRALSADRLRRYHLVRPAERIVAFYNHRGTCEQYINEGKGAIKVDAAVMPILCRQRGSPSAPCPGLQRMARPICKLRFTGMSDQSAPTYPVSRRRPGQDGDPRIPVLITSAASSAM